MRSSSFGLGSGTLASAGNEQVTERDLSDVFSRALSERRKQQPEATPATMAGDFDPLVDELINERVLAAFATKQHLILSKRLVDAEIAKIPGTRGLDGKFSDQAYLNWLGQQRLTDQMVRRLIASDIVQRLIIPPVAVNARIPVGVARAEPQRRGPSGLLRPEQGALHRARATGIADGRPRRRQGDRAGAERRRDRRLLQGQRGHLWWSRKAGH